MNEEEEEGAEREANEEEEKAEWDEKVQVVDDADEMVEMVKGGVLRTAEKGKLDTIDQSDFGRDPRANKQSRKL